jgi:Xaa-Pro aminopeptidase
MNEEKQKMVLAEQKAKALFNTVEERGLIVPGKSELQLIEEIVVIAKEYFGIEKYWHKKIVRAGINTLQPFNGNPPDRVIQNDDIVVLDFGPIFEGFEADLGRTYIIGNDPLKLKLKKDVEAAWYEAKGWYCNQSSLTGAEFFNYVIELTKRYGYEFGNEIAGHIVGPFPHEQPDDPNDLCLDIHPGNHSSILLPDKNGNGRHWILEIQFVDRVNNIGGFFEQLLNQADK